MLGVASGPGVGLAGCWGALGPPVVCSAGRSGAVVPVLVLLFVALWSLSVMTDELYILYQQFSTSFSVVQCGHLKGSQTVYSQFS